MNKAELNPQEESQKMPGIVSGPLLISDLGWDCQEVLETRSRLSAFEEDWDAPGMEAYDQL
jgi:hypothetical protein